jgi:uncharacterized protein
MPTLQQAQAWYPGDDPVHGFDHIVRVLCLAERLAASEGADLEIVRAAVLLHDAQESPTRRVDHHLASAEFARRILQTEDWPEERIRAVQHCIRAHRFRDDREQPQTVEAKVLFDADKLDAIGAMGVARAIAYAIKAGMPFYAPASQRFQDTGVLEPDEPHSAYHEYLFKLEKIRARIYTNSGRVLAAGRHAFMQSFFEQMQAENVGER